MSVVTLAALSDGTMDEEKVWMTDLKMAVAKVGVSVVMLVVWKVGVSADWTAVDLVNL